MSGPNDCEHCGYPIDNWEMLDVMKPKASEEVLEDELLVVNGKYLAICFCSCEDCALPNVWYEWR